MSRQKILKVISRITTYLLFVLFIVTVFMVISFRASGGEADLFGYQFKSVLSGSMEPEIQTGSIISIELGGDMTRFEEGDVITYRTQDHMLITHRVVQEMEDGQQYMTKGDNNEEADSEPVLAQNVVGKYTGFTVPYVGYVMNFANTPQGAALLLILPGLFLVGYSVVTIWRVLGQVEGSKNKGAAEKH
ncbi:signal peptidase, endoplasmic reticulum-type [Lentibacillus halodurans]|uniref:Signal peptidase I n=1 Tax=Lentibacillus halodurans TaxID=237679 RepID=A0A1I0XF74_9BACI|nr:signal peptidase I [Lentibacillus halodurans]SFA99672.1 signal peptidase, endoplasmic reticulum-type [Lentibacillus halodurans]